MIPFQDTNPGEKRLYDMAARSGIPLHGSFELTPLCTMDCAMCFVRLSRTEMERQGQLLTVAQWLRIAEEMKVAGTLFLLLTGGEPLLYPGFRELYFKLRAMGFILMVNSNVTLVDEDWADFFAKNPPRRINITLYGADAADYAAVCGNPAGFEKAVRGIRLLQERDVPVKLSGSLVKDNLASLEKYIALCEELELPVMTETYMMPACRERSRPFPKERRLAPEEYAEAKLRLLSTMETPEDVDVDIRNMLAQVEQNRSTTGDPTGFACKAGKCSCAINWQGHMRPCVLLRAPEVDVLREGFASAWERIRRACAAVQQDPKCAACAYRSLCPRCPAAEQAECGDFGKAPAYLCQCMESFVVRLREYAAAHELISKEEKGL